MARVNAQEYADKWGRRLKASTQDIQRGVDKVTEAPGAKAAASQQLMLQKITEAIQSGKWARRVSSVSLEDWKRLMKDKGIGRISAGVDAAMPKQVQTAERLLAAVDSAVNKTNQIPRGSLEDNINRMTTFVRAMAEAEI